MADLQRPFLTHVPKARSVIFLFMYGGPSQVDTFDHKPKLYGLDGKTIDIPTFGRQGKRAGGRIVGPKWNFKPRGQCGKMVSDLFPCLGECVDDMAFLHSMHAESPIHGSALLNMNCGRITSGHPSLGSWVNYGLGSANENLPGYVVMLDETGGPISGAKNWTSGYMPAPTRGSASLGRAAHSRLGSAGALQGPLQRELLDHLRTENLARSEPPDNPELNARINQFELAYRMQSEAPEAVDLSQERQSVLDLYGIGQAETDPFGRKCLMPVGWWNVAFVLFRCIPEVDTTMTTGMHGDLEFNHTRHAGRTDRPLRAC